MNRANNHTLVAIAGVLLVGCLSAIVISGRTAADAAAELCDATSSHAAALAQTGRLTELKRQAASVGESRHSDPDLLARLNRCLTEAGIPKDALGSHRVTPPERIGTSGYERQRASIALDGLRPAELAGLLISWQKAEPLWKVSSIRLTHPAREKADRYDAAITMETVVLSRKGSKPGKTR